MTLVKHALKFGTIFLLALLMVPPPGAWGTPGTVPPGAAGANQYMETLPGPGGNEPTTGHSGNQHGSEARNPGRVLGKANAQKLEELGPEGVAAAHLAAESAPTAAGGKRPDSNQGTKGGQSKSPVSGESAGRHESSGTGSSAVGQVVGQLSGSSNSGGIGLLLPVLIAMTVVGAAAYLLGRHRSARPQG
jgi:hypothetical protein